MAQITIDDLRTVMTAQQIDHLTKMNEESFKGAYELALGLVLSQIGEIYDVDAIVNGDTDDNTARAFRFIMISLTAWYLASSASQRSVTIEENYLLAKKKLEELKSGASTLANAPVQRCSVWGTIVSKKWQNRG